MARLRDTLISTLLATTLAFAASFARALDTRLPDLGNSAGGLMTPRAEQELGRAFMRSVRQNQAVLDDPLIGDYIQQLGERLVEHSGAAGSPFHFFAIDNREINAFAGPGGYIGVYTGLIATTQTESELAAVLAHEIAHVTQQHLLRAWETAGNMALPSAAVVLAAIAIGVAAGGDAGLAAATVGQGALIQEQINFTRANEQEADRIGIDILAEAGFDPNAMPAFFSRMGKANRIYASKLPEFLMTHPVTTNRTADALGRAARHPARQARNTLDFELVRARIALRQVEHPLAHAKRLARQLQDGRYRNRLATEYEQALSLLQGGNIEAARHQFDRLLQTSPDTIAFIIGMARVEQRAGQADAALQRLRKALPAHSGSRALVLAHAELAIALGRYREAEQQLREHLGMAVDEPRIHALLARASGERGKTVAAHRHQAEFHYLNGELEEAILQLELALKTPDIDFYDSSRIDARLRELREELARRDARE